MEFDFAGYTDTQAHLSYFNETEVPPEYLPASLAKGGFGFILDIGTDGGDLTPRIEKLASYANVRFAAGVWPYKNQLSRIKENAALLEREIDAAPAGCVVAIGECGYDLRENPEAPPAETAFLEMQLSLARKRDLPVIIHSRDAAARTIETLRRFNGIRGIIHCFSYTREEARVFLDLGWYISFAGNLTFKNAHFIRDVCAFVPENRLLLETDSPFLAPVPWRGKPCHPAMITETYKQAASLRGTGVEELKTLVRNNAAVLFRLPACHVTP
jgi:TatD DNase family protein